VSEKYDRPVDTRNRARTHTHTHTHTHVGRPDTPKVIGFPNYYARPPNHFINVLHQESEG